MINRLTRLQLIAFVLITVVGATYVGGRYAQIDRLFVDRTYPVNVDLTDSGGIFVGAEVTYRGIAVGRVGDLKFTDAGVRATLDIEKSAPKIPADLEAVVANKSAIGEQYMDLQPRTDKAPFLKANSLVPVQDSTIPIDTTTLLVDLQGLVSSINTDDLNTVVTELGTAFTGTGDDLSTILDTTSTFINDARDNIDVTRQLIRDSAVVLDTQIDKGSQIQAFSRDLATFTTALRDSDPDLRRLLDEGGDAAAITKTVIAENSADLTATLAGLAPITGIVDKNVVGLQTIFLLYPYLLQGSFSAIVPTPDGEFNVNFGAVLGFAPPVCGAGQGVYRELRDPRGEITDAEVPIDGGCSAQSALVPRGSNKVELNRVAANSAADRKDQLAWLLMGQTN